MSLRTMSMFFVLAFVLFQDFTFAASPASVTFSEPLALQPSPTAVTRRFDLSSSYQNQQVWPNWTTFNDAASSRLTRLDDSLLGFKVTCKKCSSRGHIDISSGNYNSSLTGNSRTLESWVGSGFIQYTFHNFQIDLDLEIAFQSNFTTTSGYRIALLQPLTQKLALSKSELNLDLWPAIYYGLTVNQTGLPTLFPKLSVSIPDGAMMYTNFSNPSSSFVHGLSGAQVNVDFDNASSLPSFNLSQSLEFENTGFLNASSSAGRYSSMDLDTGGFLFAHFVLPNVTSTFETVPRGGSACNEGPDMAKQVSNAARFETYTSAEVLEDFNGDGAVLAINDYRPLTSAARQANKNVTLPMYNFSLPAVCANEGSSTNKSGTTSGAARLDTLRSTMTVLGMFVASFCFLSA